MSGVNTSGTSDDSSVPPNFVAYQIPTSGSSTMEAAFESAAGPYMQHGSYCYDCFHMCSVSLHFLYTSLAVCKGMWAVKLCTNKILQLLTGGAG